MELISDFLYRKASINKVPLGGTFELSPVCNFACKMCYVRKTNELICAEGKKLRTADEWQKHICRMPIVPETLSAQKLMRTLMQQKKSLAVVVDEFGGTSGIISLEDLLEEIIGEIEDEHDNTNHIARKIEENEYLLSGRLEVERINELFDLELPESDEYQTLGGMILSYHQSFPQLNETITIDKYLFKILRQRSTKIELVKLKISE